MKIDIKDAKWTIGLMNLLILLIYPIFCKSQVSIKNVSLTDHAKKFIYIGVENKIIVDGLNPADKISFKNSKCEIRKSFAENEFSIYANNSGKDTLQIVRNNQTIFQTEYQIQYIADPKCNFPNVENETARNEDVISEPYLICKIPNNYLKINFTISRFKVSAIHQKDTTALYNNTEFYRPDTTEINDPITGTSSVIISMKKSDLKLNYGNKLTEYQINKILNLKKGSTLYISEIYVLCPDRVNRKMNDILIKII